MSISALIKKLEHALKRGVRAGKQRYRREQEKARQKPVRKRLSASKIQQIKRDSERSAAAYAAEWKRKNPELARRFSK